MRIAERLRKRLAKIAVVVGLIGIGAMRSVWALEPPHPWSCIDCHQNHAIFGNQKGGTLGNQNVCLSCHQPGGVADKSSMLDADQATPATALPSLQPGRGTSHRWDSQASGRIVSLSGASITALQTGGRYTGRYAQSYTITITVAGAAGAARFDWVADSPGTARGSNLLTDSAVPIDIENGLTVRFLEVQSPPAFRLGDSWRIFVRPDLTDPTHPDILWVTTTGETMCSACHNQHFQINEPFDPKAPPYVDGYTETRRHFMRIPNDTDQLCWECHNPRFVTNAFAGSHPVGVFVRSNAAYRLPATLPLDKSENRMWCSTCHQPHFSPGNDGRLLRAKNESALCAECHALMDTKTPATHLNPVGGPLWPGGQYGSLLPADTDPAHRGSCGNCHRVHGWPNPSTPTNDYPSLLVESGENLCYTCHDSSPSKNLRAVYNKTYKHPVSLSARHSPDEAGNPAAYGTSNRHSECVDCHNSHQTTPDVIAPVPPQAAGALRGVARVSVENISSNQFTFTYRGPSDPMPVKEYEVCFTCHSSWTTRPSGQADYAAKFNTRNASFHPVEGPGKNLNINANSFVNGWDATRIMYCTDCHTSDDSTIRGPHASTNRYILKKPGIASAARRSTALSPNEGCFDCHRYDTYANNSASDTLRNYSRFGGGNGHRRHAGGERYPCYSCHETHGSSNMPNLLITGRNPGINSYTRTANGGTCNATCHGNESYTVTYPR